MTPEKITLFLLYMPGFLFSLSFHEAAHAWMANRLGDATAKLRGRLTLNPVPHMDLLGTIIMPALGFWGGIPILAWAKPVPFDIRNLKQVRRDTMLIALAGPVSNLILAFIWTLVIKLFPVLHPMLRLVFSDYIIAMIYMALQMIFYMNLALCLFNFLPLDPLDGGKIIRGILPHNLAARFDYFLRRNQSVITWIFLILILTGLFGRVFGPVIHFFARLFLGNSLLF